jgi:hypothetical protein
MTVRSFPKPPGGAVPMACTISASLAPTISINSDLRGGAVGRLRRPAPADVTLIEQQGDS